MLAIVLCIAGACIYFNWYKILAFTEYSAIHQAVIAHYTADGQKNDYQPVNVAVEIIAAGPGWVTVNATVDSKLPDESYDVAWNRLNLHQEGGSWSVINQTTINPCLAGSSTHNGVSQVDLFIAFTEGPDTKYLAGPARQSFAMYPLDTEKYKQLNINLMGIKSAIVYSDDKMMVENYQYRVNDKRVVCDVTYYQTLDGWKIVQVDQMSV